MPLSDKKPPKARKAETKTTDDDSPWKYVDGEKQRQGRKLPNETKIHQFLIESAEMLSIADQFTATAILNKSEELAYGYARLAQDDPRVRKIISTLTSSSAWATAMVPTATILVAVAWHHGFMPDRIGLPVTMMQGLPTYTRAQMVEAAAQARREGEAAEKAGSAHSHPRGNDGNSTAD